MDLIPAYLLIAAGFLCFLFGMIAQKKSVRIALGLPWIAILVTRWVAPDWIVSIQDGFFRFLIVMTMPAIVYSNFVTSRRRIIPPCVGVNDPYRSYRLVFFLIIFILISFILSGKLLYSVDILHDLTIIIPAFLFLVFVFLVLLRLRCEICGNGIWYWWTLHTWDEYESYTWTTEDDAAVVELKYRKNFWRSTSDLVRLAVPLANIEAARQLLEANLANSASGESKA
jgi:hypothetical protein